MLRGKLKAAFKGLRDRAIIAVPLGAM